MIDVAQCTVRRIDELPFSLPNRYVLPQAPEQHIVRCATLLTREVRQQIHAIQIPFALHWNVRGCECSGHNVELNDRNVQHGVWRKLTRPPDGKRTADTAFPG